MSWPSFCRGLGDFVLSIVLRAPVSCHSLNSHPCYGDPSSCDESWRAMLHSSCEAPTSLPHAASRLQTLSRRDPRAAGPPSTGSKHLDIRPKGSLSDSGQAKNTFQCRSQLQACPVLGLTNLSQEKCSSAPSGLTIRISLKFSGTWTLSRMS